MVYEEVLHVATCTQDSAGGHWASVRTRDQHHSAVAGLTRDVANVNVLSTKGFLEIAQFIVLNLSAEYVCFLTNREFCLQNSGFVWDTLRGL